MQYVIRDRDIRLSTLKRKRKGRRLWLNRIALAVAPLWHLPELLYCLGLTAFVVTTMRPDAPIFSIPGLLPLTILATMLTLCRVLVHTVRFMHASQRVRQQVLIVEDLIASPVTTLAWLAFLGFLWITPLRTALREYVWGGAA